MAQPIILSLGGSLIVPKKVDGAFLRKFKNFILRQKRKQFIIVCGGGYINRIYNQVARDLVKAKNQDLDWIGIRTTMLNAELIRTIFSSIAYKRIINEPIKKIRTRKRVIVASGWKPGWSSDYDAVLLAKSFGVKTVINLTNIDYVYDKNPQIFKKARPIKKIDWRGYRQLIGEKKWTPRLNTPFDPIASRLGERLKLRVIILNGRDLKNLKNCLEGKKFKGTVIGD
jgi:uridylate kinase